MVEIDDNIIEAIYELQIVLKDISKRIAKLEEIVNCKPDEYYYNRNIAKFM